MGVMTERERRNATIDGRPDDSNMALANAVAVNC
jgi:hypothetical protein